MHTIENPSIPFSYPINGGLQTGSELIIHGATYNGNNKQFSINLCGRGDDVVLHVNPRFKFFEDTVVINTRTYSGWNTEERHRNRLSIGDTFRARIVCHHAHFLITINDKEVCQFEHRLSPEMVQKLEVQGDVVVHRIQMINFPQSQVPPTYYPPPPPAAQAPYPSSPMEPSPSFGGGATSYPSLNTGPQQNAPPPGGWAPSQNAPNQHEYGYYRQYRS